MVIKTLVKEAGIPDWAGRLVNSLNNEVLPPLQTNANLTFGGDVSGYAFFNGQGTLLANLTLDTVNATPGNFTNAQVNVNAKGQVTYAASGASALSAAEFIYSVSAGTGPDQSSLTAANWTQRGLNTTVSNTITGASLSGNIVTLPAGTYLANIEAACYASAVVSGQFVSRLQDNTASVTYCQTPEFGVPNNPAAGVTVGFGIVTIGASHAFQIDTFLKGGPAAGGLAMSNGIPEVYVRATFLKVA
jgi:hypothetical protein